MRTLKVGQEIIIKALSLQYADYKNVKGTVVSVDEDFAGAKIMVPAKSFSLEDERELHHADGKVFVHVKEENIF